MVPEYIARQVRASASEALGALRDAAQVERAAATTVHVVDEDGRLNGAVSLASLVKTGPHVLLSSFVELHPRSMSTPAPTSWIWPSS
jgi:Mg/Co/Ni transporter MgtE